MTETKELEEMLKNARGEGAMRQWHKCMKAIASVQYPQGASKGTVLALCSNAVEETKPQTED